MANESFGGLSADSDSALRLFQTFKCGRWTMVENDMDDGQLSHDGTIGLPWVGYGRPGLIVVLLRGCVE